MTRPSDYTILDPDTQEQESAFRAEVRTLLDLHWDARDEAIYAELRRLKQLEAAHAVFKARIEQLT